MRLNKFIAAATGISRRAADEAVSQNRVRVNDLLPKAGQQVTGTDIVALDGRTLHAPKGVTTIMLHKPVGYVVSREGQGSHTVYDLLPAELHHLKPVGRLDKDSSGLLLLTSDGQLALQLTHPRYQKTKVYQVTLDTPLQPLHRQMICDHGVALQDGLSRFAIERAQDGDDIRWQIILSEGRNRQIRRTFAALGYKVKQLHRTRFGTYDLGDLATGKYRQTGNQAANA
jgi:23S rRNA pseudouridine2605 synthase